ncbi:adenylosuccinate lyase [Ardenticatena maritima]|uniref:Adenylosuccinate lyase n=1 Tax=Ardenticatena maritima TaxID=872965 RepID=A0A0M9UCI2_9CHLR|nr:adenylosuccinate lyase [Ardenticatena maritima]KPL89198.1 adenylosuccinate lyase [Ardenticatena maritima]GAP62880.1 adenylosuccinate lyase [Ardenticatena maritima]
METFSHRTFISPFTWRYGSPEMRAIWSEVEKRRLWRRIWVALAEAQAAAGLVTAEQVADLRAHMDEIDIERAHEIEAEIHHDLMAEVRTFAEQCPVGGGIIHLGATSMDIEDNADALRIRRALDVLIERVRGLLATLADLIEREADHVCMGFTHLQPAEPTTVGYRLANYAQDLLADYEFLQQVRASIRGKGFKGAVGTAASYAELLAGTGMTPREMERRVMEALGLEPFLIAHQTYPRRQDWLVLNALAGVAMTLYRLAFDVRLLQSPPFGEWREPFGKKQVGSSAMPFKRNPINAENIDSLTRFVAALPRVAWDNAAHSLLERTLDDSGNRRAVLPEAFLATEEAVLRAQRILARLTIDEHAVQRTLSIYGTFAASERVLMEAVRAGGDRQHLHEVIREHSMAAWAAVQRGEPNPLPDLLANDPRLTALLPAETIRTLLDATTHIGDAPNRARELAAQIRRLLEKANASA